MKYSKQRELIKQTVKENKIHPAADDVYAILKPNNPNLSLGTVYRNLSRLAEEGIIKRLHIPNGSDRFDDNIYEHYHVICNECGEIFDVEMSIMNEFDEKIKAITGVTVISHHLIINGICENCISRK